MIYSMENKTVILNSEWKFRNYVFSNFQDISRIIIFEDILEHVIFLYCFHNDLIVGAKSIFNQSFSSFISEFNEIAKKINFSISYYNNYTYAIELLPKKD